MNSLRLTTMKVAVQPDKPFIFHVAPVLRKLYHRPVAPTGIPSIFQVSTCSVVGEISMSIFSLSLTLSTRNLNREIWSGWLGTGLRRRPSPTSCAVSKGWGFAALLCSELDLFPLTSLLGNPTGTCSGAASQSLHPGVIPLLPFTAGPRRTLSTLSLLMGHFIEAD